MGLNEIITALVREVMDNANIRAIVSEWEQEGKRPHPIRHLTCAECDPFNLADEALTRGEEAVKWQRMAEETQKLNEIGIKHQDILRDTYKATEILLRKRITHLETALRHGADRIEHTVNAISWPGHPHLLRVAAELRRQASPSPRKA